MKRLNSNNIFVIAFQGFLNSYAQIMFSKNAVFAVVLLLVSFMDLGMGIAGVVSIVIVQLVALLLNFNRELIRDGSYSYAPLMTGICAASIYELNVSLLALLPLLALLTFFFTVALMRSLGSKNLPFLSLPFLFVIWVFLLGAVNFSSLHLQLKETYSLAKFYPEIFDKATSLASSLPFANLSLLYLRSLGAIFFQYNDLAGLMMLGGLLYFSRIATLLSVFGFAIGYFFYSFFEGDFTPLVYSYIGFNFILTSIALGGFFLVPSRASFLILLIAIPLTALLTSALHSLFTKFGMPLYSLPFNVVTILFISVLQMRLWAKGVYLTDIQQFSPEANHYKFFNRIARFNSQTSYHISLPVLGEWFVSQGHAGTVTHKTDWQFAWDFDVRDDDGKTYRLPGIELNDYYCYDLPVVSPGYGWVTEVADGIADNKIGDVNTGNNWGNTVVIKHAEYLFTKLSHLRAGSIKVKPGDYVVQGEVIGSCGSSGRSPEPHLHFQLQATPFIGSKTLRYPISYYLSSKDGQLHFYSFSIPKEGEKVSNVRTSKLLREAFYFPPGKTVSIEWNRNGKNYLNKWEVFTNAANYSYFYCHESGSVAYFVNDGTLFYFTDFYGDKSSALHHFYLAAQRVLLGYYKEVAVEDKLMIEDVFPTALKVLHDTTAPFFHYCRASFKMNFVEADSDHEPEQLKFVSKCEAKLAGVTTHNFHYIVELKNGSLQSFEWNCKNQKISFKWQG